MSNDNLAEPRIVVVDSGTELLVEVVAMGDRHRKTLGPPLPPIVFATRADADNLLAAVDSDEKVLGYVLYDIAKNRVRLVHLCVDPSRRNSGLARRLVDEISKRHDDLPGISVSCRADYAAAGVWPRIGFSCTNERPGRGAAGATLQMWWRSHAVEDLFSQLDESDQLLVAIDHNVFIDLVVQPNRVGAERSAVLTASHLDGVVRLAVTKETFNEITRVKDTGERKRQRGLASAFHQLDATPAQFQRLRERASALAPPVLSVSDFDHLLHAAAGGASVFVTRDENLIHSAENIALDRLGLRVVHPETLLLYLAEIENADRFRPAALNATSCTVQDSTTGVEGRLSGLLSTRSGERRKEFNTLLRSLASDPDSRIRHVTDAAGDVVVGWAERRSGQAIEIPLLRHSVSRLADTVLRLLLFELRSTCLREGRPSVSVSDTHRSPSVSIALAEDGFENISDRPTAFVCSSLSRLSTVELLPRNSGLRQELLDDRTSLSRLAELERHLWPCKLLDVAIPNWIIPIRPVWARELLRLDDPLLPRPELLGLSRELVYYRSAHAGPLPGPSRVLWYASDTSKRGIGAIVGCSQIVSVSKDNPDALYRQFQHLGVYERKNVHVAAGKDGRASAIRFVNTELFDTVVPYEALGELAGDCRIGRLQSPTAVGAELFGAVYQQGTRTRGLRAR